MLLFRRKLPLRAGVMLLIPWLLAGYFGFFLWNGNYGLKAMQRYRQASEHELQRLRMLEGQRVLLARRTAALRDDAVQKDTDMLREQVRRTLNYADPDDTVIPGGNFASGTAPLPR